MAKELTVIFGKRGPITNGDVMQALFPHLIFVEMINSDVIQIGDTNKGFAKEWWDTPYKMNLKEVKNDKRRADKTS